MNRNRSQRAIACALAYALVLHGLLFSAFAAGHAALAAEGKTPEICAQPGESPVGGGAPLQCDCGPACLHAGAALAGPDQVPDRAGALLPVIGVFVNIPDTALRRPDPGSLPHISRGPPAAVPI